MTERTLPEENRVASKAAAMLLAVGLGEATGLGLVLRQHRLALGLSLHAAAKASGVSSATLCEMELGTRFNPTLTTIRALTKLYNLKPTAWFK
jgi:DNA-binding XRE family transcriptional regulator